MSESISTPPARPANLRVVGGTITDIVEEDYTINSESTIVNNAATTFAQYGEENGVSYGEYDKLAARNSSYIIDSFWSKTKRGKERTTNLLYKRNNDAYIYINFKPEAIGKNFKVEIYSDEFGFDTKVYEKSFSIEHENTIFTLGISGKLFSTPNKEVISLYYKIVENARSEEYCNSDDERLKVHLVRYIPSIMSLKNWDIGFQLQEKWFNGLANSIPGNQADIANIVTMEWVLSNARAKKVYNEIIRDKLWVTENAKRQIVREIVKMNLSLPSSVNSKIRFGTSSIKEIYNNKGEKAPKIDLHHFQEKALTEISSALDDFNAAIARFVFRIAIVEGYITKLKNGFKIELKRIGIYLRDSYDYVDSGFFSQDLGYWSPKEMNVSTNLLSNSSYHLIENSNYQEYRNETGFGMDFLVYSDVKIVDVNDSFNSII